MTKFETIYEGFMQTINEQKFEYVLITYNKEKIVKDDSYKFSSKHDDLEINSYEKDHAPVLGSNQTIYKLEDAPFIPKETLKNVNESKNVDVKKIIKKFGNDPLYINVVTAKSEDEQKEAVDILKSVRGETAYKNLFKFIQDNLK